MSSLHIYSNSWTMNNALVRFLIDVQIDLWYGYLYYWIKNSTLKYSWPQIRILSIFFTSSFSWLIIKIDKGENTGWFVNNFGHDTCFCNRDTWKTRYIFTCDGCSNLYDISSTHFNITKVSRNLRLNLEIPTRDKLL